MASTKDIHLTLRTQLVTASGIPDSQHRARENRDYTPNDFETYIEEEFVPGPRAVRTLVPGGLSETMGLYVVKVFAAANNGINTIRTLADAILDVFSPGSTLALSGGGSVRIRTDPAPFCGQILPTGDGWSVCTVTIPWRVDTSLP